VIPSLQGYSVTSFTVRKGNELLRSRIMEKNQAKQEFSEALDNNKDAYLVSQSDL